MTERVSGERLQKRCANMYAAAQRWWEQNGIVSEAGRESFVDTSYGRVRVLEYGFERENAPLLFNLHGGGWILLHAESDEYLVTGITANSPVRVVSIDYPKGPENKFPAALEASYEVMRKYAGSAPCGIMGQSAGGNMAAAMCLLNGRRGGLNIAYQIINYPVLDMETDAYDKPEPDPEHMPSSRSAVFAACYKGIDGDGKNPLVSPIFASAEELIKTPPALVIACGIDALRREALKYAEMLEGAGVSTELCDFPEMRHAFTNDDTPETAEAAEKIAEFINRHI